MAWFICPYKWVIGVDPMDWRYCAMNDFTEDLRVDAGRPPRPIEDQDSGGYPAGESPLWAECEFLGDRAIVKVHTAASETVLTLIATGLNFLRIPAEVLDIAFEDQNVSARDLQDMWAIMQDAGYTLDDILNALGVDRWQDLRKKTFREFGHAVTSRWRRPKARANWSVADDPEFEDVDWAGGAPSSIEIIDDRIP